MSALSALMRIGNTDLILATPGVVEAIIAAASFVALT
jgi:hypothetical protein